MKKTAVLIYNSFCNFEFSVALEILALAEKEVVVFAHTKEAVKSEDGLMVLPNQAISEINIDEYDSEIVFETYIPIDGIKRGWVGDLYYHIGGYPFDCTNNTKVTSVTGLKEVLLARVTITARPDEAVIWKYTFLKD